MGQKPKKNGEKVQQLCNFSFFHEGWRMRLFPFQPEVRGVYDWEYLGGLRGIRTFLVIDIKGIQRRYGYVLSCFNK